MKTSETNKQLPCVIGAMAVSLLGCSIELPALVDPAEIGSGVVLGRILTVIAGQTSRRYLPEIRSFEVVVEETRERFTVEIRSDDRHFVIALPPGDYRLNRVQINEGPFMPMADMAVAFSVETRPITYVGTWRFEVDSSRYGRIIMLSMVLDQDERERAREFLSERYPTLRGLPVMDTLPQPSQKEARLYEVMPYPRYSGYFRWHWW